MADLEGTTSDDAALKVLQGFQYYSFNFVPGLYYHYLRALREKIARGHREHKQTLDKTLWKYAKVSEGSGLPRLLIRTGKYSWATCCYP